VQGKPLPPWSDEYEIKSWAQLFLKFILSHPTVTCAIPATTNPLHMNENLEAGTGKFADENGRKKMADYFRSII
jgi:diketogulonate reductase-like aldo/keto reductase